MDIFVCVKQVPSTNKVQVDERTGVLVRDGVASKTNPYDLHALEAALRLRDSLPGGGRVVVGAMGPPQAEAVIREAYCMGADEGYLFSDRQLARAVVLATSYTLSQAIRAIGDFDIIFCGKQTTDGDTAQVGPAIAEHMGIPHAAWVSALALADGGVVVEQQLQETVETVWLPFPCLITVEQGIYTPRLPSLKRARQVRDRAVARLTLDDFLDKEEKHYGLAGSPTQVERIFPPPGDAERILWTGDGCAERLHEQLLKWKFAQR